MTKGSPLAGSLRRDAGARLFVVFWGSLATVDLAALVRAPLVVAVAAVALVVAAGSRRQGHVTAVAASGIGCLFVNGFAESRLGVLAWHGGADVRLLLLLGVVALAAADLDAILTRGRRSRRVTRVRSKSGSALPAPPGR
jgi:hypothetical protein